MMIRGSAAGLFIGGVMLWMFSRMVPLLQLMMMDFIGIFMMAGAMFILFFCFPISGVGLQYDTIPTGTAIVNYIRRDGIIVPLLGKRVFSGESFLDVPKLGLVEDLGKDTVFLWGRKKVRFGLENINYTVPPRYWNLTHELYKLGFDDTEELTNVLNVNNMDPIRDSLRKAHYLERMAEIYHNMMNQPAHGTEKLIRVFKSTKNKNTVFGRKRHQPPEEHTTPEKKPEQTPPPRKEPTYRDIAELDKILNERKKKW